MPDEKQMEDMSVDDLAKILDAGPSQEETPPPPPTPEPVAVQEEAKSPVADPAAEPEAAKPESDLEREILESRMTELEARARHWESVAGKNGGEVGHLRKMVESFREQQAKAEQNGEPGFEPEPVRPTPRPGKDAFEAWAITEASNQAAARFEMQHPDSKDLGNEIRDYLVAQKYDGASIATANDPIEAATEATRVLTEAYWHVRAQKEAARRAELTTKRADQTKLAEDARKKAAISGSGGTPPPKPRDKTFDEMDPKEIGSWLDREMAGRWK